MRRYLGWLALLAAIFAIRLTHRQILWVEEAYPAAAAIQMEHGLALYRDVHFDKPPLSAAVYLLWAGHPGWPLRLAGSIYVTLCGLLAFLIARRWWTTQEAWLAALLLAFYLTFGIPASVMALAPDMLTLLPVLAAVLAAAHGRAGYAGVALGVAVGFNGKAILLLPMLGLAALPGFALGAVAPLLPFDLAAMWDQVWRWGAAYSRDSPITAPLREGLMRTGAWLGFQMTAAAGAAWFFARGDRQPPAAVRLLAFWTALSFAMACLGLRFSPRYYLVLLPPLTLAAARGLTLMPPRLRAAALALLLIPALRFGPMYAALARNPDLAWSDTAMNRDARHAAEIITKQASSTDTILVWGYRPDILVYTRLELGAPFLDSQPLTGVIADRHLRETQPTFPALAARNRARLLTMRPTWIVDGLGPYNPELAIANYPDLAAWLSANYERRASTEGTVIYRLRP